MDQTHDPRDTRLRRLYELSATLSGEPEEVFDRMAMIVAETFGVRAATVQRIDGDRTVLLSMYFDGRVSRTGEFPLQGTPCENVRARKQACWSKRALDEFPDDAFLREHGLQAYLGVPVLDRHGEVVGVVAAMHDQGVEFSAADASLLRVFGQWAGLELERLREAGERKRLFDQAARHVVELTALQEVGAAVVGELELHSVLQLVAEKACTLTRAETASVSLLSPDGEMRTHVAGYGTKAAELLGQSNPAHVGLHGWVIQHQQPLLVNDVPADSRASDLGKKFFSRRSAILAPLQVKGRVIGCLSAFDKEGSLGFTTDDLRLLTIFAGQAAVAIQNARLYESVQKNLARLEALQAITRQITADLKLEDLLANLARAAANAVEAGHSWIGLLEPGESVVRPVASHRVDQEYLAAIRVSADENVAAGRGPGGIAMRTGRAHIVRDCLNDPAFAPWREEAAVKRGWRTLLVAPLVFEAQTLGVIAVFSEKMDAYAEDDIRLLETLAAQAAIAIKNAQLYEEVRRLAITDPLTGLHNRRFFDELLDLEIHRAKRHAGNLSAGNLSLVFVDLDDFKRYNDLYGHRAGDSVLRQLAEVFRRVVRQSDVPCRWGGEEFAVLLPQTGKAEGLLLAERLRCGVADRPFLLDEQGRTAHVTITLGLATCPDDALTSATLVSAADAALLHGKTAGKNRVCDYAIVEQPPGAESR